MQSIDDAYSDIMDKYTLEEELVMTLKYLRQYVTKKELAYEFEIGEATVHDTIVWVENTLVKDEKFKLPRKNHCLRTIDRGHLYYRIILDCVKSVVLRIRNRRKRK